MATSRSDSSTTRPRGDRLAPLLPALRDALVRQRAFRVEQLAGHGERARSTAVAEVNRQVAAGAQRALADIDRALAALNAGRYGRCEKCGVEIPPQILLAIPQARLCMECHARIGPA
ncbi:TraR/DksA family transcriptional regulator [Pseudonocardia acaciae]|uniref:TraR/DksA family transcriptional regulator n=1 Tax=Pseudonocardia acaciae TaxID=551276 RepID=UPI000687CA32|nr:TraR/DksA C4-type zinc finger protein [Pseudonocardia acaciae]